ncbi:hypothetical protein [Actinopolymorpha sp. B9G3]|uniref:hypothetical protein n=1 Tax=Actinopolymorpha sp. B9G3 TaxID=3158970 RepID=UPI0032D90A85
MYAPTTAELALAEKLLKFVAPLPMIGGLTVELGESLHVPARPTRGALCALSILLAVIPVVRSATAGDSANS